MAWQREPASSVPFPRGIIDTDASISLSRSVLIINDSCRTAYYACSAFLNASPGLDSMFVMPAYMHVGRNYRIISYIMRVFVCVSILYSMIHYVDTKYVPISFGSTIFGMIFFTIN